MREAFIKRHVVERTNTAEVRPDEQSEKAESWREKLWNKIHCTTRRRHSFLELSPRSSSQVPFYDSVTKHTVAMGADNLWLRRQTAYSV